MKHSRNLLKEHGMQGCKAKGIPMANGGPERTATRDAPSGTCGITLTRNVNVSTQNDRGHVAQMDRHRIGGACSRACLEAELARNATRGRSVIGAALRQILQAHMENLDSAAKGTSAGIGVRIALLDPLGEDRPTILRAGANAC